MATYMISNIKVFDPNVYQEYRERVTESIKQNGGQFVIRGAQVEKLEGAWQPERLVVIRFTDRNSFNQWWNSEEYQELRNIRDQSATAEIVITEGI